MMMTTVLVTGAAGFVGSHTLLALQAMAGATPIALVRDPKRLPREFAGEVRTGDIRDAAFVRRALKDVDAVCAAAAWTSVWGHAEQSRRYFLEPVIAFLEAAAERGIKRAVFPSSVTAGVLRNLPDGVIRGKSERIWPHLTNVLRIEDRMAALAARGPSMIALRLGHFVGERYGLGLLPLLLPRLRTHLVPWVDKGRTTLPLIAGSDIGRAMALTAVSGQVQGFAAIEAVGKELPTVREVFRFLHEVYGYPLPRFGVPFPAAYAFARVMELASRLTPWDPFIARSIILLLEETAPNNETARRLLGYEPQVHWKDAIRAQLKEMQWDGVAGLPMVQPAPAPLPQHS
jgi:nucleoside-diphosphate-sugar epimerase